VIVGGKLSEKQAIQLDLFHLVYNKTYKYSYTYKNKFFAFRKKNKDREKGLDKKVEFL
jgi:hypothetical protein